METVRFAPEWYALNVRSRQEHAVSMHLSQLGQEQFLPVHPAPCSKAGGVARERPLFPGYVFCRLDWQAGPKLYKIPGIIKVVGSGKTPLPIPEAEIEAVRRLVALGVPVQSVPLVENPNSTVVVNSGPLQGITGVVVGERNSRSLIVSIPLLRRSLAVVLDRSWLAPTIRNAA